MRSRGMSIVLAGLLAMTFGATDASAWFRFKNKTNRTIWVAFMWYKPGCDTGSDWATAGWWKLSPGQTKTVYGGDLQDNNTYFYYYAHDSDGREWKGPYTVCVPQPAFSWCDNICNTAPSTHYRGFREKYINGYNNYTINLVQ